MSLDYADWKGWEGANFGALDPVLRATFDAEMRRTGLTQVERVAEIGFGGGSFMRYCRERGWAVQGTELLPSMLNAAQANGFDVSDSIAGIEDGSLDLIVAFDVLEHLSHDEIGALLELSRQKLRVGGVLLARFPNADSALGNFHQHGDVTHITQIGSSKVSYFAQRHNLELRFVGREAFPILCGNIKHILYRAVVVPVRGMMEMLGHFLFTPGPNVSLFAKNIVMVARRPD